MIKFVVRKSVTKKKESKFFVAKKREAGNSNDYRCVGVSGIFLILQPFGRKSINEKFHSRFFRSKRIKEEKNGEESFGIQPPKGKHPRKKKRTKLIVLCKEE